MAFTGLHITAAYVGPHYSRNQAKEDIVGKLLASETMDAPGTSTLAAPEVHEVAGMATFRVSAAVDAFVAIGIEPDANAGPRDLVRAGETVSFYAEPGHRLAWVAA
jgi:hypothetical protein